MNKEMLKKLLVELRDALICAKNRLVSTDIVISVIRKRQPKHAACESPNEEM